MPNKENIKKVVDALRSGEFIQGFNKLEYVRDGVTKNCCLGVACRVAMQNGVDLRTHQSIFDSRITAFDDEIAGLPKAVLNWLGINDEFLRLDKPSGQRTNAMRLNDTHRWSFDQIADLIEGNYLNT